RRGCDARRARPAARGAGSRGAARQGGAGLLHRGVAPRHAPLPLADQRRGDRMSTVTFDVAAVRRRFSALQTDLAFFDGPGGTQVPDSVIEAVSSYFRELNAKLVGPYGTIRRTEALVAQARIVSGVIIGGA